MTSIRQTINALIPSRPDRKLVAENERLREALHKILRCVDKGDYELRANPDEAILRNSSLQIHSIACEALKEPDDG